MANQLKSPKQRIEWSQAKAALCLEQRLVPRLLLPVIRASSAALPRETDRGPNQCVLFAFLSAELPAHSPGSTGGCPGSPGSLPQLQSPRKSFPRWL